MSTKKFTARQLVQHLADPDISAAKTRSYLRKLGKLDPEEIVPLIPRLSNLAKQADNSWNRRNFAEAIACAPAAVAVPAILKLKDVEPEGWYKSRLAQIADLCPLNKADHRTSLRAAYRFAMILVRSDSDGELFHALEGLSKLKPDYVAPFVPAFVDRAKNAKFFGIASPVVQAIALAPPQDAIWGLTELKSLDPKGMEGWISRYQASLGPRGRRTAVAHSPGVE